jgi:tRNA splicing endonuclease
MNPVAKRKKFNFEDIKPFPSDCHLTGYFTGLDVEVFDENSIKILSDCGCYGLTSKPRQVKSYSDNCSLPKLSNSEYERKLEWKNKFGNSNSERKVLVDQRVHDDPFDIPQSLILLPEEAFFLQKELNCLEIQDLNGTAMTTEELWEKFCATKHNFAQSYVAYVYCKSKNWVIKPGSKFGGQFCKLK